MISYQIIKPDREEILYAILDAAEQLSLLENGPLKVRLQTPLDQRGANFEDQIHPYLHLRSTFIGKVLHGIFLSGEADLSGVEAMLGEFESEIPKEDLQQKIVSLQGFKDFYQLPHLMEEWELYLSSKSCAHQDQMIQIIVTSSHEVPPSHINRLQSW